MRDRSRYGNRLQRTCNISECETTLSTDHEFVLQHKNFQSTILLGYEGMNALKNSGLNYSRLEPTVGR